MSFVEKYTITLPDNKLEYYKKWKDNQVFKNIHVAFKLEDDQLKQVSGGNPLDKYDEEYINTVIGVGGYLDQLHKEGIYHGDIITGVFNKETQQYDDLKINVGNILKDRKGEIKLIDFGPIDENEKRSHDELMRIEKKMLEQVREEGVTKTYSPKRIKSGDLSYKERQKKRERDNKLDDDDIFGYYSGSDSDGDSDVSLPSPPKRGRINHTSGPKGFAVRGNLFDGGKKKRRRTKKKRRRKRKSTKKKKKIKRKRTKKKRRRRR